MGGDISKNNAPDPCFPCRDQDCAESTTHHADMLAMHPDGGVVCEACWNAKLHDGAPLFYELPEFTDVSEIGRLRDALTYISTYRNVNSIAARRLGRYAQEILARPNAVVEKPGE